MRRAIVLALSLGLSGMSAAQFQSDAKSFFGGPNMPAPKQDYSRSASKPTTCGEDTSYFPNYGTTAYNSVSVKSGSSLGQYFGANQNITVSGFRFYGYSIPPTPARQAKIRVICNLYKAGSDSLPAGLPLASDTITVDTVMGSSIPLARITREAVFKKPVTLNYDYIITVETDSTAVSVGIVANSWTAGNGKKKNLGCGSVSGKWYRCLNLNIGGVTFDSDIQLYPFVKYKLGADFNVVNDCYNFGDTVKFQNLYKSNVSGLPYYNYYLYYKLDYYTQRWSYDGSFGQTYIVDGFYKPLTRKNFDVQLISVVYSYTNGQCYDTTLKTVYFKPSKPTIKSGLSACKGDTVAMNIAAEAGVVYKWYHNLGGAPFFTGNSLLVQNAQVGDTFYIQGENGNCKSAYVKYEFSVNDYPSNPVIKNDSICLGAIANLSAKTDVGRIEWFKNNSGGAMLFTGDEFQSEKLLNDTFFYVQANNKGCLNKGGRVLVKAWVSNDFAPSAPGVVTDTFVCLRPSKKLTLFATHSNNDTLRWYNSSTGKSPIQLGDSIVFTPKNRGLSTLYLEAWNGVCGSGRTPVNINIYDYPSIFGLKTDTICKGREALPTLDIPWGEALWYSDRNQSNLVYIGKNPSFTGLNSNTKYYIVTQDNNCTSPDLDSVAIVVHSAPVPSAVVSDPVCFKSMGSLQVKIPSGKVNWYYDIADQSAFAIGQTISAGLILGNVTYYYETEEFGCKSGRTPLTVVMKPRPTAGFTWALQWQNKLVCTPITTAGINIGWDWGDGKTSTGSPYVHVYSESGQYMVRMVATSTSNGCKDTADIPVNIDHTGVELFANSGNIHVYPVPSKPGSTLHISGIHGTEAVYWLFSTNGSVAAEGKIHEGWLSLSESLPPGMYVLTINDAEGMKRQKILVGN